MRRSILGLTPILRATLALRAVATLAVLLLGVLVACRGKETVSKETVPAESHSSQATTPIPASAPQPASAAPCQLPHDVTLPPGAPSLEEKQYAFDVFSWASFIALSCPADPQQPGQPRAGAKIGDPGPLVWETYKASRDIFLDPPTEPTSFSTPPSVPQACLEKAGDARVFSMATKISTVLDENTQAFTGKSGWLIDQNGQQVHYEVLTNEAEFDFIVAHRYYDSRVQAEADAITFPAGANDSAEVGAIEIKAAWKRLGEGDDAATFYVRQAYAYDAETDTCTGPFAAGLVGLHIAHKTATAPQWIWSTFEHVANVPSCRYAETGFKTCEVDFARPHYSFANAACPDCPLNVLPTEATRDKPVQVARIVPIPAATQAVNKHYQEQLKGTVFAHYELVNTQWPTRPTGSPMGEPQPISLANTTMETYFQGQSPLSESSSCIGCHFLAQTTRGTPDVKADFSFQLARAYPHVGQQSAP